MTVTKETEVTIWIKKSLVAMGNKQKTIETIERIKCCQGQQLDVVTMETTKNYGYYVKKNWLSKK